MDKYVKQAIEHAVSKGYRVLLTADHGNIEILRKPDGSPHVAHTSNLVACIGIGEGMKLTRADGKLCDVSPTILKAMGIRQPEAMTGSSFFDFDGSSKVLLLILDGWGLGEHNGNNPIYSEETPYWDSLLAERPYAKLQASGPAVGLEEGKPGNSEAGHINLGSGRVVLQDDVRLDRAMKDGSFAENKVFIDTIDKCKEKGTALHLFSLLTKKSSHGSIDYPLAILDIANRRGLKDVYIHIIFDGRSTDPGSAPGLLRELGEQLEQKDIGLIVSGVGRGVALDRDLNWAKVRSAYDSLVSGTGIAYTD